MAAVRLRRLSDVATGIANWRQCLGRVRTCSRAVASPCSFGSSVTPECDRSYKTLLPGAALGRGAAHRSRIDDIAGGTIFQAARFHDGRLRRQIRGAKVLQAQAVCAKCNTPLAPSMASIYPLSDSILTCANCRSTESVVIVEQERMSASEMEKVARDASGDSISPLSVADSVQLRETVQRIAEWHASRRQGHGDEHWQLGAGSPPPPSRVATEAPAGGSPYPSSTNLVWAHPGTGGSGGSSGPFGSRDAWGGSLLGKHLPTPREICQALDKFVVGQERAKKARTHFTSSSSLSVENHR